MTLFKLSLLLLGILCPITAQAQRAVLSSSTETPLTGEPFRLSIQVDARKVGSPNVFEVEGLEVLGRPSKSSSFSMINGRTSASTTLSYTVAASEEGILKIGPLEIAVDQRTIKTNALTLTVKKGSGRPQPRLGGPGIAPTPANPRGTNGQPAFPSKLDHTAAFVKVVPARTEIYAGESVEVSIKAYFDAGIPIKNFARELTLAGEDFITKPTGAPDAVRKRVGRRVGYQFKQERIDGRLYNVLTYKTTISAVKPGDFTLAPIDYSVGIQVPNQRRQRARRGSIFGNDPFDDPFFNNMLNMQQRELRLQSEEVKVTVLPLPTEGQPDYFTGAIGRFSLDVLTDKKELEVDDALKVAATITGHGNFNRITQLNSGSEDPNWKAYPPEISFDSDDLELSGEKTFEYTYIATAPTDKAPAVRFAYFDPEAKNYVSLGGDALPVTVTGVAATALTNQDLAALADQATTPGSKVLAALNVSDPRLKRGTSAGSWIGTGTLLGLNGGAAALALGLAVWQWKRRDRDTLTPKQQRALLLQEREALLQEIDQTQDLHALDQKILRALAVRQHFQNVEAHPLPDEEAARLTINQLEPTSQERLSLEDFLDWSAQRRWSGAEASTSQSLDTARCDGWRAALKTLEEQALS